MLLVSGCGKDVTEPPPDIDIEPDVDPVTVQLVFPGLRAEATAASADSIPAIRETQLTDSFTVAFWDGNGQVFVPGPEDRVEINVGAGLEVVSAGDSAFALRGLSGAQASLQVSVVSPTRIRFEAAAFSVAVLALPTSVVLAAGSDALTATVSAVDGTFRIDTDDALALVVTLEDSTGQELAFLQGESVALEFLGDGTVATLVPEGDSLTLRGRLPGTDSVQVRLNAGERELVAFAPVPIEVEEAPCSGPTADGICLQKMASGFRTPAHLTSPPGDDRLMVAQTRQGWS